jgi:putative ABC transport system permease protein
MILLRLVRRRLMHRPGRTLMTAGGVAGAMLLLVLVRSLSDGLETAMSGSEAGKTLVVYRQNRYCPQTSNLPQFYADRIAKVPGVVSVLPVKVFLNNCRASLDLVAFQGAPADRLFEARKIELISGDAESFRSDRNSAIVGRAFAARKGLEVGDQFRFGPVDVKVAGVFTSSEPVEEGVVLTHLEYLQRTAADGKLGTVTQFDVKVDDASRAKDVATAIDALFKSADSPTDTRAKVAFLEDAVRDLREILRFASALAAACVAVVLALVANTVVMSVQERIREFGVLRTLGYGARHLAGLVLAEAAVLSLAGGGFGVLAAILTVRLTHLTFGAEGVTVALSADAGLAAQGLLIALAAGAVAGLLPAWRASRVEIVAAIRGT